MKALACALLSLAGAVHAASWQPERNVELIVGTAPGGGSDSTARLMQRLFQDKKLIERPAVVSNKPGGGGAMVAAFMTQNAGSAHHLLVVSPTLLTKDRKSTRLNSSHIPLSRMPSSA